MDHPQIVETDNVKKAKRRSLPKGALVAVAALVVVLVLALVMFFITMNRPEPAPVFDLYSYDAQGREVSHTKQRADGTVLFRRDTSYGDAGSPNGYSIYNGSGSLLYREETAARDGLLSEKQITTGQGLSQRTVYEYESGVLVGKSFYDMYGNLTQYIRYTADGKALYWEL